MKGEEFEAEVSSIARALWPQAEVSGPVMRQGRERDGEYETAEITHLVECTIERTKSKAEDDIEKLRKRIHYLRRGEPNHLYKGWFVTLHEPTADQRAVAEKATVPLEAISFREFRRKLVDAEAYLSARDDYPFGSVRDPRTNSYQLEHRYIALEFLDQESAPHALGDLLAKLKAGDRFILTGDFGAGKSTTLRELFRRLRSSFLKHEYPRFPVVLNLRDHHAQTDPTEALERHARRLGYSQASHLVRGWRAGYVDLLLDGFDEIAVGGWAGSARQLRDLRYRSMELIRGFIQNSPRHIGIVVAGRAHYFDNSFEMRRSLTPGEPSQQYRVAELRGSAVQEFLDAIGWEREVPEWVPTRPLLLGYLAARGILEEVVDEGAMSPAVGWHSLLSRISEREAELEAGPDPTTIRRLIEEVAVLAREANDGLGMMTPSQIVEVFLRVCGYEPDDRGTVLLQRLPGLGAHHTEDGARVFVDRDFANAAAGSALARHIQFPYDSPWRPKEWQYALSTLGLEVAALQADDLGLAQGEHTAALNASLGDAIDGRTLTADLIGFGGSEGYDVERDIVIKDVWIPEWPFYVFDADLSRVILEGCVITHLEIPDAAGLSRLPRFHRCDIAQVTGCSRERDLPDDRFVDCEFAEFEDAALTTSALLDLDLPLGVRVGLTILKKLYRQSGSGRRENALYRGLDQESKRIVPEVLDILRRYGLTTRVRQGNYNIWLPTKDSDARARALELLDRPTTTSAPVLVPLKALD